MNLLGLQQRYEKLFITQEGSNIYMALACQEKTSSLNGGQATGTSLYNR